MCDMDDGSPLSVHKPVGCWTLCGDSVAGRLPRPENPSTNAGSSRKYSDLCGTSSRPGLPHPYAVHLRCDRTRRSLYPDFSQSVHTLSCLIQRVTSLVVRVRRGWCVGKRTPSPCRLSFTHIFSLRWERSHNTVHGSEICEM